MKVPKLSLEEKDDLQKAEALILSARESYGIMSARKPNENDDKAALEYEKLKDIDSEDEIDDEDESKVKVEKKK